MSPYPLPGGRIAVERLADRPRAAFDGVSLLARPARRITRFGRKGDRDGLHAELRRWARHVVRRMGIELRIQGLDEVDPSTSYVVAPLHEGFADVAALLHLPLDLVFVARDELTDWALLGKCLIETGQIIVTPERPLSALRTMLTEAGAAVGRGSSIVAFPQGTILGIEAAFQQGPDWLAARLDVPVLPVVVAGSHRVWEWPFSPIARYGQPLYMEVLEPVAPGRLTSLAGDMRRRALANGHAPVRRFDPERDGYWDGYRYEIDPEFGDLAARVAGHRARRAGAAG